MGVLTFTSVLPWRGWPRRQGFWRRNEGTATAGRGLGFHPAPCPFKPQPGGVVILAAPHSALSEQGQIRLSASKTQCGPCAERRKGAFKDARSLKKNHYFKGNVGKEFSFKENRFFKENRMGEFERTLGLKSAADISFKTSWTGSSFNEQISRAGLTARNARVNLEGGLCNTPLYNYLGVGERK
jgi:hypothetical protein